jgi:hypothetical protein
MKIRLLQDGTPSHTKSGRLIARKFSVALEPLLRKWAKRYDLSDLELVLTHVLSGDLCMFRLKLACNSGFRRKK